MKKIIFIGFFVLLLIPKVFAHDYVLPYPSYMPGNKLYRVSRILDKLQEYWHWGSIAQEEYHLGLSDKYLVEAKTLLEYRQYLLGVNALKRSNDEFLKVLPNIQKAHTEGIDVNDIMKTFISAEEAHEEVLDQLKQIVPITFEWTPEKVQSTSLSLHALLDEAVKLRQKDISKL